MSVDIAKLVAAARAAEDPQMLVAAIPYARFIGLEVAREGGAIVSTMRFGDHLIGDATIPALHGGTLAALLESTAIFAVLFDAERAMLPKTITLTIDYLRSGRAVDTKCRARIVRQGRRVVVLATEAFQDDASKPVATAIVHLLVADD
jgi:uncharacterized protein (TIGR00369 family)